MELFYGQIMEATNHGVIEKQVLEENKKTLDTCIDQAFRKFYKIDPNKKISYKGQWLVVKNIVGQFAERIIQKDLLYAPFVLLAMEKRAWEVKMKLDVKGSPSVLMDGIIDRIDQKGSVIRIVDYKTGKDIVNMKGSAGQLFQKEFHNKAAMQTLFYAYLFYKNSNFSEGEVRIVPGLYNRNTLFGEDSAFGLKRNNKIIENAIPEFFEFEEGLRKTLEEMFDPEIPFQQTRDLKNCQYCSFNSICYR